MSFKEKKVLVTGAGSGIGKAIAKAFAKNGAYLIINDLREDRANSTQQEIVKGGGKAVSIQSDVSSKEQVSRMVNQVIEEFGWIDVLVNNAGIFKPSEFFDLDEKGWDRTFAVNVKGMFLCSQLISREMIKRNTGRILNLASITAKIPFQNYVDYCCTKAAVVQFTRVLALILAPYRITVNAIAPGSTEGTEMWEHIAKQNPQIKEYAIKGEAEKFRIGIPLGRLAKPEDQASMVLYLASEDARHITGQTIFIDGGSSIF
ncbi:MAG: SDR family oxidoreductase [Deltaproteobacteria bacterium]|nr:SDR family oxidoreductase [Deltaproteobacteria bacterium]